MHTQEATASRKRAPQITQLASPILFTVYLIQALMSDHLEYHGHPRPFVDKSLNWKTMRFSSCDVQSRMQLGRPHDLVLGYTRLMMGFLLFVPTPRHIAIVGLGGGSLAKFCYRYVPDSRIQVVEINPHVIALRDDFEIPQDDHRFHVCKEDAADHVRTTQSRYDVIMADGFDANGVPADLGSRSFYDNCFDVLEQAGVLVVNLHRHHECFPTYLERIKRSFAGRVVIVNDLDLSNTIVFAFKQMSTVPLLANLRRCAAALTPEAWQQLAPSFSRIEQFGKWHGRGDSCECSRKP